MTLEIVPSIACNLSCSYCYQDPMRNAGNYGTKINLGKVIPLLTEKFTVFGGEPLLVDRLTLERLWGIGLAKFGENSIQTNGALIDDDFIRLFIKYNVSVGLSVDGPGELNDARCNRETTKKIFENIEKLLVNGIYPGIHVVLNKHNASERLSRLLNWVEELDERGIREVRFHLLEEDTKEGQSLALKEEEAEEAFLQLAKKKTKVTQLQPFLDMRRMISNEDINKVGCIFKGCDPYTTSAVHGVNGDGTLSNCGRTSKDGINFRKADTPGKERLLALYNTPYKFGGCKDCRFFFACKGECPGGGIGGDWRNRTKHCSALLGVYNFLEKEIGGIKGSCDSQHFFSEVDPNCHGDSPHDDIPHQDRTYLVVPVVKK